MTNTASFLNLLSANPRNGNATAPVSCKFITLLLTAFALCLACTSCKQEEAVKTQGPPEVLVAKATTQDIPVYREWIGTLQGSENAQIRSRVQGHIMQRDYQEGALVKKGELLFEIDPRPFEAAMAEAKSQLAQTEAVQRASQADYQRSKELYDKKVISEKEYVNKLELNQSNIEKIQALKANMDQAKLNLEFCKITSPVDGIAGLAKAQIGDLVGPNSPTELTEISTLNPIKVVFPISENEYLTASDRIQETMNLPIDKRPESIELILADGSIFPHKGRLQSVDREVKASTGTILVTALVDNPGNVLRPGFFARARIIVQTLKDAVVVPQRAIYEIQGSYQIGVVGPDGKAEIRPVKVGKRLGMDWVITSGLSPGEEVIVEGMHKVKAGMQVATKPWTPIVGAASPGYGVQGPASQLGAR